jgi:trans-aconitate methyltransferase
MTLAKNLFAQEEKDLQPALMAHSFEHDAMSWDALLTGQVDIYFDSEAKYLSGLQEWQNAQTILDIGCGNGNFLGRLRETFPEKKYIGIDVSTSLIEIAEQRHRQPNLSFKSFDIQAETWPTPADVLLLRFVCQHLANPRKFFEALHRSCKGAPYVVVAEPSFVHSRVFPEIPELFDLISQYDQLCGRLGNARSTLSRGNLADLCGPDWQISREATVYAETRPSQQPLGEVFHGWITAIESTRALPLDFSLVRESVHRWLSRDDARAELALKYWLLLPARVTANV